MAKTILVALSAIDEIDKVTAYLEEVVKPGTKVVFMFPFPLEGWPYWRDHWVDTDSTRKAKSDAVEIMRRYSWQAQSELLRQKISAPCELLKKKDIEVKAGLYSGSLRCLIEQYKLQTDIQFVVMATCARDWFEYLLASAIASLGWQRRRSFPPPISILHQIV